MKKSSSEKGRRDERMKRFPKSWAGKGGGRVRKCVGGGTTKKRNLKTKANGLSLRQCGKSRAWGKVVRKHAVEDQTWGLG